MRPVAWGAGRGLRGPAWEAPFFLPPPAASSSSRSLPSVFFSTPGSASWPTLRLISYSLPIASSSPSFCLQPPLSGRLCNFDPTAGCFHLPASVLFWPALSLAGRLCPCSPAVSSPGSACKASTSLGLSPQISVFALPLPALLPWPSFTSPGPVYLEIWGGCQGVEGPRKVRETAEVTR